MLFGKEVFLVHFLYITEKLAYSEWEETGSHLLPASVNYIHS